MMKLQYIVDAKEMAAIDDYSINTLGIPQMVLMERAALSVYEIAKEYLGDKGSVLVVVEGGNNGGDGIAVARLLKEAGYEVVAYYIHGLSKESEGFLKQLSIAKAIDLKVVEEFPEGSYDVVIDGILGVGLHREVSGLQAEAIKRMNQMSGLKLAIDIPSGIDATTGKVLGVAFRADKTVTFGYKKLGMLMEEGILQSGEIIVSDIGFPALASEIIKPRLYTYGKKDLEQLLPKRKIDSHKGSYGRIGIIAGSKNMAGASLFSAMAAYRTGCGLVKICTTEDNREIIQTKIPEAMLTTYDAKDELSVKNAVNAVMEWAEYVVIGPGLSTDDTAKLIMKETMRLIGEYQDKRLSGLVIDADGINLLSPYINQLRASSLSVVITPHLMEMARLIDKPVNVVKSEKIELAREFAKDNQMVVVLKDARTIVSDGSKQEYINTCGTNGMATGGSGDVLTGVIAGLMGQGLNSFDAAKLGVALHGFAGEHAAKTVGVYSMIASDLIRGIEAVMEEENCD